MKGTWKEADDSHFKYYAFEDYIYRSYYDSPYTRDLCHLIKEGNNEEKLFATLYMATWFAKQIVNKAGPIYLVPAPQHTGNAEYTLTISKNILTFLERTDCYVLDAIGCKPHETLYKQKKEGNRKPKLSFFLKTDIPEEKGIYLFIDNVISSGNTFNEANKLFGYKLIPLAFGMGEYAEIMRDKNGSIIIKDKELNMIHKENKISNYENLRNEFYSQFKTGLDDSEAELFISMAGQDFNIHDLAATRQNIENRLEKYDTHSILRMKNLFKCIDENLHKNYSLSFSGEDLDERIRIYIEQAGILTNINKTCFYEPSKYGFEEDGMLHVLIEYEDEDLREDSFFNSLSDSDEPLLIGEKKVDFNPIRKEESGSIETYLAKLERWGKEDLLKKDFEDMDIIDSYEKLTMADQYSFITKHNTYSVILDDKTVELLNLPATSENGFKYNYGIKIDTIIDDYSQTPILRREYPRGPEYTLFRTTLDDNNNQIPHLTVSFPDGLNSLDLFSQNLIKDYFDQSIRSINKDSHIGKENPDFASDMDIAKFLMQETANDKGIDLDSLNKIIEILTENEILINIDENGRLYEEAEEGSKYLDGDDFYTMISDLADNDFSSDMSEKEKDELLHFLGKLDTYFDANIKAYNLDYSIKNNKRLNFETEKNKSTVDKKIKSIIQEKIQYFTITSESLPEYIGTIIAAEKLGIGIKTSEKTDQGFTNKWNLTFDSLNCREKVDFYNNLINKSNMNAEKYIKATVQKVRETINRQKINPMKTNMERGDK